ncbi:MAG: helix-turn-helix transcriptional regulator [Saprospiraceae bacterium]|nr:helix-turn-helix transcriptional regulator [Saprospiraceae bacterium]
MTLFIKNMVCGRCIKTVERLLDALGLETKRVELGELDLRNPPEPTQLAALRQRLAEEGFELLDDRNSRLVAQIKNLVVGEVHHQAGKKPETMNFSDFLARQTGHEYSQLSKLFSSVEGITIEKYIIAQKIERVKELLVYDEHSLGEIAWQMGYSSTQHLSNQFRQVTGLTPTQFKAGHRHHHPRKMLDTL